jgi:TRAP-type C4-dicarboxylate transport system substrate-binding protein
MKKTLFSILISLMVFSSLFAQGQKETEGGTVDVTMKIQHNLPRTYSWQAGFEFIKSEMEKRYPEIDATIYPDGQLAKGDWKVILEQTQSNVVQMTSESQVSFASLLPELIALSTPFLFDDMEHVLRFMDTDPEFVNSWFSKLEEKNLKVIAYWPRAPRQLLNSVRPIVKPEDIKGLKFRVPGMDLFLTTFEAFNAKPVPLPSGEIYTAMQLGTVVGEDNSLQTLYSTKTYEQGKYINIWNYMGDGVLVVANKDWFDGLPADFRDDLLEIAAESASVVLEKEQASELVAREEMEKDGIEFIEFTQEMKEPWINLMDPVYAEIEKIIGEEDWEKLKEAAEATRH